jgi:hypothetical protein
VSIPSLSSFFPPILPFRKICFVLDIIEEGFSLVACIYISYFCYAIFANIDSWNDSRKIFEEDRQKLRRTRGQVQELGRIDDTTKLSPEKVGYPPGSAQVDPEVRLEVPRGASGTL